MTVRIAGNSEYGMRYYSDPNRTGGSFLFETFPASRSSLALKPEWNSMLGFKQYQIRPGAIIIQGKASAQGSFLEGGQMQKFIANWREVLLCP